VKKNQIILIIALLLILLSTYLYINKLKNNEIINIENTENI